MTLGAGFTAKGAFRSSTQCNQCNRASQLHFSSKRPEREFPDATVPALQFCADVPPGNARAKECLEDNREQPGFSLGCKAEVEKMMENRASDFRLDPKLRQLCADDIQVTHHLHIQLLLGEAVDRLDGL